MCLKATTPRRAGKITVTKPSSPLPVSFFSFKRRSRRRVSLPQYPHLFFPFLGTAIGALAATRKDLVRKRLQMALKNAGHLHILPPFKDRKLGWLLQPWEPLRDCVRIFYASVTATQHRRI